MRKEGWLAAIFAAPSLFVGSVADAAEWETFGDWQVAAVHDEMDPTAHVVIRTTFTPDAAETSFKGPYTFGFRVFGGSLISLDTDLRMSGKNFWPHCDYDTSSYRIDGGRVAYLATVEDGGSCDDVSLSVISAFRSGKNAKLKLDGITGDISLRGFSAAWNRLRQLSR